MLSTIIRTAALAAAFALAACGGPAAVDTKDPKSVVNGFVAAYNAKDVKAMLPLIAPGRTEPFEEAAADKNSDGYKMLFGPMYINAFKGSHGVVDGPRYSPDGVWFKVNDIKTDITVLEVAKDRDGRWYLLEVLFPDRAEYDALPTTPPPSSS